MRDTMETHDLNKADITVRWIASYKNVPGNEAADVEAKRAATDEASFPPGTLPSALRNPLLQDIVLRVAALEDRVIEEAETLNEAALAEMQGAA